LDDEFVHLGEVAGERDVDVDELPGCDRDVGAHLTHVARLRKDERVASGRNLLEYVVPLIRAQRRSAGLYDGNLSSAERRIEVLVVNDSTNRARALLLHCGRNARCEQDDKKETP